VAVRRKDHGIFERTLPDGSKRYDVRYRLPSGKVRTKTLRTITDARAFQATVRADKARGGLVDPKAGRTTLDHYVAEWLASRADLRPRTADLYRSLYRLHIAPDLGRAQLAKIDPASVRAWHATLTREGTGPTTIAKAYRLLRTILGTAVADGRILVNPCQIKKAGAEQAAERPTVTPAEVVAIAAHVPEGHRSMVLLAGICGLRLGEALGLAVRHVDLLHGTLRIERQLQEIGSKGEQVLTEPKSAKGRRTIALPASVLAALRADLDRMEDPGPDSFLFTGAKGGPLRRCVWNTEWNEARVKAGHPALRFHDLRHSALTLYAATGATIAELQAFAGHASPEAAMRYQHATRDRASALAELVDRVIAADKVEAPTDLRAMDAR
jgi:integrase